jgi:hypothetical protein
MTQNEPSINDLNPLLGEGVEKEPIALIDTSGSMSFFVAEGSTIRRWDVVAEAMGLLVLHLEDEDSQAAAEQASGDDDEGGLLTYGFSDRVVKVGDLNSSNWRKKWADVKVGGGTVIMPAWQQAQEAFVEEFADKPIAKRPMLMTLVITDGTADDAAAFGKVLETAGAGMYFTVAIVGYGKEHDNTLRDYKAAEAKNPKHVRVVTFGGETDPTVIADGLKSLVG